MWTVGFSGRETNRERGSMEEKKELREMSHEEEGVKEERVREGLDRRERLSEVDIGRERGGPDGRGEGVRWKRKELSEAGNEEERLR